MMMMMMSRVGGEWVTVERVVEEAAGTVLALVAEHHAGDHRAAAPRRLRHR
jgi:hypothetical protein